MHAEDEQGKLGLDVHDVHDGEQALDLRPALESDPDEHVHNTRDEELREDRLHLDYYKISSPRQYVKPHPSGSVAQPCGLWPFLKSSR